MTKALSKALSDEREVLRSLIKGNPGLRAADGTVSVRSREAAAVLLYGPYWKLSDGTYRLEFRCQSVRARDEHAAFIGVEVIAQNRTLLAVADFSAAEMPDGIASIVFEIDRTLAVGGDEPMIEFRFLHFGAASFSIDRAVLKSLSSATARKARKFKWRLSSRARRRPTAIRQLIRANPPLWRGFTVHFHPWLSLPSGQYELSFRIACSARTLQARRFSASVRLGRHACAVQNLSYGGKETVSCHLTFQLSEAVLLAYGIAEAFQLHVSGVRLGQISDLQLTYGCQATASVADPPERVNVIGTATLNAVIIGNCQAEILTERMRMLHRRERLQVTYHLVGLPSNLRNQGLADLEKADALIVQDIRDFETYPLKSAIPAGITVHRFPMLRHSSPWPFDTHNGLSDAVAAAKELAEPYFPNLDSVLGRLRQQVPDPQERLEAYRRLDMKWLPDFVRLDDFERRRLEGMDRQHGSQLGSFILENYRRKPVLHSIGHPGAQLFDELLAHIHKLLGIQAPAARKLNDPLADIQVPVHPVVAERLGLRWAREGTLYNFRGHQLTWAQYIRRYIAHFG